MNVLGVDVGATGIKGAIVSLKDGTLISERVKLPTPASKSPHDIAESINQIIKLNNWQR